MNQAAERQSAVIDALSARGIDAEDISTAAVSLQPQFGENSMITGLPGGQLDQGHTPRTRRGLHDTGHRGGDRRQCRPDQLGELLDPGRLGAVRRRPGTRIR